ncbi:MAG: hypothetical protein HY929_07735 [Euryarchaeota archaeon]|nr:hypothetical protein [Euryarchaeota archaeon]
MPKLHLTRETSRDVDSTFKNLKVYFREYAIKEEIYPHHIVLFRKKDDVEETWKIKIEKKNDEASLLDFDISWPFGTFIPLKLKKECLEEIDKLLIQLITKPELKIDIFPSFRRADKEGYLTIRIMNNSYFPVKNISARLMAEEEIEIKKIDETIPELKPRETKSLKIVLVPPKGSKTLHIQTIIEFIDERDMIFEIKKSSEIKMPSALDIDD